MSSLAAWVLDRQGWLLLAAAALVLFALLVTRRGRHHR